MSGAANVCPRCQSALPASAPEGLCPKCLWGALLGPQLADDRFEEGAGGPGEGLGEFGGYELLSEIARGGMGVVYRARQTSLGRVVALKMILTTRLPGEADMLRFLAEAGAIASLEHPNIVPIHEVGEEEGRPYFTMKYIPGGSLADRLAGVRRQKGAPASPGLAGVERVSDPPGGGRLSVTEVVPLIAKIARAVHYAHQRGILHRDLKPSNILLDERGEPLVSDFGLAKRIEGDSQLTLSGAVLGTPAYIAPEQAVGAQSVTTAADVYSLGAVFYEMLAGRPPFHGATPLEILRAVLDKDPVRPGSIFPGVERDLETICLKCLRKAPADRYSSAEALAEDLDRWARREPIQARRAGFVERTLKWSRRHAALTAFLLLALVTPVVIITGLLDSNARVKAAEEVMAENLYAADMFLADRALREGNLGRARASLTAHLPPPGMRPGGRDFRGFEWRWLWRQSQGDQLRVLTGFPRAPAAIAISPDGRTLAIGGQEYLWRWGMEEKLGTELLPPKDSRWLDPAQAASFIAKVKMTPYLTNQIGGLDAAASEISRWVNPEALDRVTGLSFSPDGRSVISSTTHTERAARVWNMTDGKIEFAFPALSSQAIFSPTAPIVAVGSRVLAGESGCVKLYDLERRSEIWALPSTGGLPAFSGDGQILATAGWDLAASTERVTVWSMAGHRMVKQFSSTKQWDLLALSPDGRWVALAGANSPVIELWSVGQGRLALELAGHAGAVRTIAFSPDSQLLATAGADQIVRLWSIPSGALAARLTGHNGEISSLAFFSDGHRLASASRDGSVRIWSTATTKLDVVPDIRREIIGGIVVSPDGAKWTSTSQGWESRIVGSLPGGAVLKEVVLGGSPGQNEGFDDAGQTVVSSFYDAGLSRMNLEWHSIEDWKSRRRVSLDGSVGENATGDFCATTGVFAAGEDKGLVRVWSARTGKLLHSFGVPDFIDRHPTAMNLVNRVVISPDGSLLAAGMVGNTQTTVFSLSAGKLLYSMHVRPLFTAGDRRLDPGLLSSITFSPDSLLLATTDSTEPGIHIWEARTGREVRQLSGHRDHTRSVAFSPDGKALASTGGDGSLKLWHLPTGREVATVLETGAAGPVAFSPNGELLIVGLSDHVRIFRAPSLADIDAGR